MSAQIIDFAATLNARHAAAEIAKREESAMARIEAKVDALRASLESAYGQPLSPAGAEVVAALVHKVEAAETITPAYMPAYCDPNNEKKGSKYDATQNLWGADLAKRIRQDIKDAQKRGEIPAGVKVSVRTRTYAGGYSIDAEVTALPAGFRVTSDAYASWVKQFGARHNPPLARCDQESPELRALMAKLEAIHGAYNRDNSDSMVDYFDRRYYGNASLDWQVRDRLEKDEVEASAGDYWSEDCRP
jgi:hypothetical protein